MQVVGDQAARRLLVLQLLVRKDAEIAKRIDIAAMAIFHGLTEEAVSDLDLFYTPQPGSPGPGPLGAQAWTRRNQTH